MKQLLSYISCLAVIFCLLNSSNLFAVRQESVGIQVFLTNGQNQRVSLKLEMLKLEIEAWRAEYNVIIEAGKEPASMLFLQGLPINEPVVQHGPFVMNTPQEIQQAISDYRSTQFGGWPWERYDHVHPHERGRFARYSDGREESREGDC